MPNHQTKKGAISILLAVLILTSVFIIVFGLSGIMLKQIRMSGQASDSVKAYQAADSGIEWALYQVKQGIAGSYCLEITAGTQDDPEGIKSIGKVRQVRRAVEVAMAAAEGIVYTDCTYDFGWQISPTPPSGYEIVIENLGRAIKPKTGGVWAMYTGTEACPANTRRMIVEYNGQILQNYCAYTTSGSWGFKCHVYCKW
jgi:Tfp pilus assembly protein PilV